MSNSIIGIQCRLSSKRLPKKALLPLGEITILGAVISRCIATDIDTYILTSKDSSDDLIVKHSNLYPIKGIIRGPLENVQERYRILANETGAKNIIRVTADNPFTDSLAIKKLLEFSLINKSSYSRFADNELPIGFHSECFEAKQLFKKQNQDKLSEEHVTYKMRERSIYNSIEGLGYNSYIKKLDFLNCTVDTIDDYKKALYFSKYIKEEDYYSINLTYKLISLKSELINNRGKN